ncbi:transposable element Tcb2 transposase [Trichonephila clavipes]|nr:transposable element Tcb2 transposase [Trichonephila clavipes]
MNNNHDSESKFEKSDGHETKEKFSNATSITPLRVAISSRLITDAVCRRHVVCVPLSSENKRVLLKWCSDDRDGNIDQSGTNLFPNESRVNLTNDSHNNFIWREPESRYLPSNIQDIDQ